MAKCVFKAYDLQRKKLHTIKGVTKITEHRFKRSDWSKVSTTSTRTSISRKCKTKAASKRAVKNLLDVIGYDNPKWPCNQCGKMGDDPNCDETCHDQLKAESFLADNQIDIKGPDKFGYGAYTAPGVSIKRGQYIGEYLGELQPIDHPPNDSKYLTFIPQHCMIDSERFGNWTRFVNHSCDPNMSAKWDCIGKRNLIVLRARRNIGPEEELTFNYGEEYFRVLGFKCRCSVMQKPHKPLTVKERDRKIAAARSRQYRE